MPTFAGTDSADFIIPTTTGVDYRGGKGDDTYILSGALIPANATIVITDTEGANKIQLADGLVITSSSFLANAVQLTLSNGAKVQITGASTFTYDIGANATAGDTATTPNQSYTQFATTLGVTTLPAAGVSTPVAGTPSYTVPSGGTTPTPTTPTFSVTAVAVTEGNLTADNKQVTFTATLDKAPTSAVTVNYATSSGSGAAGATSNADFVSKTGTITFAANTTTLTQTFTVDIIEDTAYEPNETFTVAFTGAVGATIAATSASVTATITDDDPNVTPVITKPASASGYIGTAATITGLTVADTNDGNLTVTLTAPAGALLTVTATAADGSTPSVLSTTGTSLSGIAANSVIVSGSKSAVNATLATFAYLTNRLEPGTDTITIKVEDPNGAAATATGVATTTLDISVGAQSKFTSSATDNLVGTGGSDIFVLTSALSDIVAGDKVAGGDGIDTVKITLADGSGFLATGQTATTAWTGVEIVDVTTATGAGAAAATNFFDGDSVAAGMTTFNYTDGEATNKDNLTLLDMATGVAVNLKSDVAAVSVGSKAAASTLSLNLADGVDIATSLAAAASTVKPATLNITTAGTTGNFITAFAAPGATVNVSGTAAVTFGTALATTVAIADATTELSTFNATDLAGALKVDLSGHTTLALTTKGGSAADTITGATATVNTISGNGGNDTISIAANAVDGNSISGNAGDDTITGGTGADAINGGAGKDTLTGGLTGVNTFVFTTGDSTSVSTTWDTIADLKSTDKIDISGYGITGTNGVALSSVNGAKAADGVKDVYVDTSNQTLVIETSDAGGVVATEKVAIGIAALGALTSNGAGVLTVGPVALSATNDEAGTLTIKGTPIGFPNTNKIIVAIDGTNIASVTSTAIPHANFTDGINVALPGTFLAPVVDMNGDGNFKNGVATPVMDANEQRGVNGVNNVDASALTANGIDIAGNAAANILKGSLTTDIINGYAGNDTITGDAGDDVLLGGVGMDSISGGDGADAIVGGADADSLAGGAGIDTFGYGNVPTGATTLTDVTTTPGLDRETITITADGADGGAETLTYTLTVGATTLTARLLNLAGVDSTDVAALGTAIAADINTAIGSVVATAAAGVVTITGTNEVVTVGTLTLANWTTGTIVTADGADVAKVSTVTVAGTITAGETLTVYGQSYIVPAGATATTAAAGLAALINPADSVVGATSAVGAITITDSVPDDGSFTLAASSVTGVGIGGALTDAGVTTVAAGYDKITDFTSGTSSDKIALPTTQSVAAAAVTTPVAATTVAVSAGGKVTFAAADTTLTQMLTAVAADNTQVGSNKVVFFENGTSTYVYGAGADTTVATDDFLIELTGVTGLVTMTATAGILTFA